MNGDAVVRRIEQLAVLDRVSEPLPEGVGALVPEQSEAKDALSGTWLGHPVHPPLTDVVVVGRSCCRGPRPQRAWPWRKVVRQPMDHPVAARAQECRR